MTPYATAQKAYRDNAVLTATPEQLVVMLYDGARRFLTQAAVAMRGNDLPTAAFTATEVSKGVVKLNGTQSTDPDGLALSYKWWDNGKALSSTSSETESGELTVGSEHTFKLEVSTPSGLKASSEAPPMKIA